MIRVAALLSLAVLVAGCGGGERSSAPADVPSRKEPPSIVEPADPERRVCAGDEAALGGKRVAYATVAERETSAFEVPGGKRIATFGVLNANGHATVFGVRRIRMNADCGIEWYRVQLPMRPNGSEGWIHAGDVRLYLVDTRITVDLSKRELVLYRAGHPIITAPVAIGAPGTPTPTGRYYVNQRLIASDPTGPWGPGALGISAFSDVLQEWIQGGPIAIHGTNDPSSIGQAASHGCIRLDNGVLRRVFRTAEAGTPVIIEA